MPKAIHFDCFNVTTQVFYQTSLSFGLVNLKPILPGHVLVCPLRRVGRVSELTTDEATDFFSTVRKISGAVEKLYQADALNISIQDGPLAGQSVPHVHCHIIPRRLRDLPNVDDVYKLLDSKPGDLSHAFSSVYENRHEQRLGVDADERPPRSLEVMEEEARKLKQFMQQLDKPNGAV